MDATLRIFDFTTFDFGVVALCNLDSGTEDVFDFDSLHGLLGAFTLEINASYMAVTDD